MRSRSKSKNNKRSKSRARGGLSDVVLKVRHNNQRYRHDVNRIDSLFSPGSPYTPKKYGRSKHREQMHDSPSFHAHHSWDTKSLDSGVEEDYHDLGFDKYTSVEQRTTISSKSGNKENNPTTPIANPLHRLPPRMLWPGRSGRKQAKGLVKSSSVVCNRKEQLKRDIATAHANMKEDELGNIAYKPRSAANILASKNSNIFTRSLHHMNTDSEKINDVPKHHRTRLAETDVVRSPFRLARQKALIEEYRSIDSDETEPFDDKFVIKKKKSLTKPKSELRDSSFRLDRQRVNMNQRANFSPTSAATNDAAPTKYIYAFDSSNTMDDDDVLTFRTEGECEDLTMLNDTIRECIGLGNGIIQTKESKLKVDVGCEDILGGMTESTMQMDKSMVKEFNALGGTMDRDCEPVYGCEVVLGGMTDSAMQMEENMVKEFNALGRTMDGDCEPVYGFVDSTCADNDPVNPLLYAESEITETNDMDNEGPFKVFRNALKSKSGKLFGSRFKP
eukprot:scaffold592_cov272-Chaetoceros_neogracile.AAC.41